MNFSSSSKILRPIAQMSHRVLSVLEKAKLVCWFEETNSVAMVARRLVFFPQYSYLIFFIYRYRAEFGVNPPSLNQIKRIHQQFLQTGSVLNGASAINGQCAASTIEAAFGSPLLRKNTQLSSLEAEHLSQLAMKGPIERFA